MWKFSPFLDFVKYIIKLDVVSEVIIINNDNSKTPDHPTLNDPKIKMFDFGKNIYVNPAWNAGVNSSKSDIVCIMNDDLIFDIRLFYKVDEFINPKIGAIGQSAGVKEFGQTPVTTGEIYFQPFIGQNCFGFGELMFLHKDNWVDIPKGLDIGFGDIFIFERLSFSGKQNYFTTNMFYYHASNSTTKELPKPFTESNFQRERALYQKILHNNFKLPNDI